MRCEHDSYEVWPEKHGYECWQRWGKALDGTAAEKSNRLLKVLRGLPQSTPTVEQTKVQHKEELGG